MMANILRLPSLNRRIDDDPANRCALCGDSGWERCWELVTWFGRKTRREFITEQQFEEFSGQTEGVFRREVYTSTRPCRCTRGEQYREAFEHANGNEIEPVPVKPAKTERVRNDGKARASGE